MKERVMLFTVENLDKRAMYLLAKSFKEITGKDKVMFINKPVQNVSIDELRQMLEEMLKATEKMQNQGK